MFKRISRFLIAGGLALGMIFATGTNSLADSYTVKAHDSLWKIAKEHYGDGSQYGRILAANADLIKDPRRIYVGQVLFIPDASLPAGDINVIKAQEGDIFIVYTNDVHSYIYNTVKNDQGEESPGLRVSNLSALVQDMRNEGKNVLFVDAGDEIQGNEYGDFDKGESVISLMNEAGYQLATPGNHEFDYGTMTLLDRVNEAKYPYISCNFHVKDGTVEPFLPGYVFEIGGKKIAFVGISTPETFTTSRPTNFQDENGNYLYTIDGLDDKNDLYLSVQSAIDSVGQDADYVIGLGHLGVGVETTKNGFSSRDVIANVTGLDAFIDGHSHSTIESEIVKDKSGKDVILTQTGNYLNNVGLMKIGSEGVSTSLIKEYANSNPKIKVMEDEIHDKIMKEMGEVIGTLEIPLYINDPDNPKVRLIRSQEMNSGDFVSDAVYWFFNEKMEMGCDLVLSNGGSIRAQLDKGDINYLDVKTVQPFGNQICMIKAKGQDIIDALEVGASLCGEKDDSNNPAENGGFLHVAGMKYTVDTKVPNSVKYDEDGNFVSVDGDYRVKDVMIYDKTSGEYKAIEPEKFYTIGGINYILRDGGNGLSMFSKCDAVVDFAGQDYVITADYVKAFGEGKAAINTSNSPIKKYKDYLIDYENPYGAQRILIQ